MFIIAKINYPHMSQIDFLFVLETTVSAMARAWSTTLFLNVCWRQASFRRLPYDPNILAFSISPTSMIASIPEWFLYLFPFWLSLMSQPYYIVIKNVRYTSIKSTCEGILLTTGDLSFLMRRGGAELVHTIHVC